MVAEPAPDVQRGLTIERMRLGDVEHVVEVDRQCFSSPWSAHTYTTELENPSAHYVVAKYRGDIVGFAGMWLIADEAHITTIGVAPCHRGRKIGERVLIELLSEAVQRGARRATLEVRRSNTVAQSLYAKYGFRTVAIRRGYYGDNGEDAFVMWVNRMWEPEYLAMLDARRAELGDLA